MQFILPPPRHLLHSYAHSIYTNTRSVPSPCPQRHDCNHNHKYRISLKVLHQTENKKGGGNGIKEIQHKTAVRSLKVVHHQLITRSFSRLLYFLALAFLSFVLNPSKNAQNFNARRSTMLTIREIPKAPFFATAVFSSVSCVLLYSSGRPFSPVKEEALKQYGSIAISSPL